MVRTMRGSATRAAIAMIGMTVVVASLAACGSESEVAGDNGTGPIRIGAMGPVNTPDYPLPEVKAAIEKSVEKINEEGGVQGRNVEVDFCDTKYDPNGEVACARDLAESGVAAVVYPYATLSVDNVYRIFERARIPVVGHIGVTPADQNYDLGFPLSSGLVGWWYGAAAVLVDQGAKKISIISIPSKVAEYGRELASTALEDAGLEVNHTAIGEINTADWSAIAARATKDGTDGILVGNTPVDAPRTIAALRAAGFDGPISTISSLMTPESIAALGKDAEGVHVISLQALYSDASNRAVAAYQEAMKEDDIKISEYSLQAWAAVRLYASVMDGEDGADAKATLSAFENLSEAADIGITAPYAVKGAQPPEGYPRMFNPTVSVAVVKNGGLVASSDYVNPFELAQR